jgi:hypothetical protein
MGVSVRGYLFFAVCPRLIMVIPNRFMSTTSNRKIALQYSVSPVLTHKNFQRDQHLM